MHENNGWKITYSRTAQFLSSHGHVLCGPHRGKATGLPELAPCLYSCSHSLLVPCPPLLHLVLVQTLPLLHPCTTCPCWCPPTPTAPHVYSLPLLHHACIPSSLGHAMLYSPTAWGRSWQQKPDVGGGAWRLWLLLQLGAAAKQEPGGCNLALHRLDAGCQLDRFDLLLAPCSRQHPLFLNHLIQCLSNMFKSFTTQ